MTTPVPPRDTYRHGNLRHALLTVGIALARAGGPDAVILREATRQAGVVPNAAYRHFADRQALLEEVSARALAALALAIEAELARAPADADPATAARAGLRAVGTGYLRFAQAEPGLFRTAFAVPTSLDGPNAPPGVGERGLTPLQLLTTVLDDMVAAGVLPPERRPGAEFLAWSAVHGLATLVLDGPLRSLDQEQIAAITQQLLDMVERGL